MARKLIHGIESRWMLALCASFLMIWALPVSWLVYHPETVEISGDQVVMYRSFPGDRIGLPRPRLSYIETVRPLTQMHNGGQSCTERGGPFQYSNAAPVGTWSIAWAADCLSDPQGFTWDAQWTWHIGALRVGPVGLTRTVLRTAES